MALPTNPTEEQRERNRKQQREYYAKNRVRMLTARYSRDGFGHKSGDACWNWTGDDVGYFGLHAWVRRHLIKTGICSHCGVAPVRKQRSPTHWANISGEYRRDLTDYAELCVSCHRLFDHGKLELT